jgi:hypothetical protein
MKDNYMPSPVYDCFHIYSYGTNVNLLFESREDKIFIMNIIAAYSYGCGLKILVDQIMNTHFHIIASGNAEGCNRFSLRLLAALNKFINRKGRSSHINGKLEISIDKINDSDELKNKIIYVYRNALAAGCPLMPWKYEWGPGDIYFVDHDELSMIGTPLSEMSYYVQRRKFHTHARLPKEWRVNREGMILPQCYFDWKRVEQLFGTPFVFISFLHQKKEQRIRIEAGFSNRAIEALSDSELRKEAKEMCRDLFGRSSLSKATISERISISRKLWQDSRTSSVSKLSRATLLSQDVLRSVLNIAKD